MEEPRNLTCSNRQEFKAIGRQTLIWHKEKAKKQRESNKKKIRELQAEIRKLRAEIKKPLPSSKDSQTYEEYIESSRRHAKEQGYNFVEP